MARRQHITLLLALAVITLFGLSYLWSGDSSDGYPFELSTPAGDGNAGSKADLGAISDSILKGGSIAPKLGNETAKAELGRASWKLFHTMMARFPEKPEPDDSLALKTYIQLFARLYPCGECAAHFRKLLEKYPPQTSGRNAAAGWACFVHNQVNKRLKKPEFDCNKIGDFYDCGCGEEGKDGKKEGASQSKSEDLKERSLPLSLEKEEGLMRGG